MTHHNQTAMPMIREQIKTRIAERGYSVRSVATAARVAPATLSKWLAGHRSTMPLEATRRVAAVLGWSLIVPSPRLVPLRPIGATVNPPPQPEPTEPTAP